MIPTTSHNTRENWFYSKSKKRSKLQYGNTAIRNMGEKKPLEVMESSPSLGAGQSPDTSLHQPIHLTFQVSGRELVRYLHGKLLQSLGRAGKHPGGDKSAP